MEDQIKKKIQQYSLEAEQLANRVISMDSERNQIQERLTQLVGAISALNSLLTPKSSQTPDDSTRNRAE